jgi:hypothetical protein
MDLIGEVHDHTGKKVADIGSEGQIYHIYDDAFQAIISKWLAEGITTKSGAGEDDFDIVEEQDFNGDVRQYKYELYVEDYTYHEKPN